MEPSKEGVKKKYRLCSAWNQVNDLDILCIIEERTLRALKQIALDWKGPIKYSTQIADDPEVPFSRREYVGFPYTMNRMDVTLEGIYFVDAEKLTTLLDVPWEELDHSNTVEMTEADVLSCLISEVYEIPKESFLPLQVCVYNGERRMYAEQYAGHYGVLLSAYSPLHLIPELNVQ